MGLTYALLFENPREDRQDIRRRLAGPRLRFAQHILTTESQRDGLGLHESGLVVPLLCNSLEETEVKAEVCEAGFVHYRLCVLRHGFRR